MTKTTTNGTTTTTNGGVVSTPPTSKVGALTGLIGSTIDKVLTTVGVDTYRWRTRLASLYALYTIDDKSIDAYMNSYILFDGDWSNDNGKSESNIVDYYHVINHLCALGNVEKMYIPPLRDPSLKSSLTQNQELYELKMMEDIHAFADNGKTALNNPKKIVDIGCGRGRVAMHVAKATGAHVTGINIDPSQIANAQYYSSRIGLQDKTKFQVGSLNDPLPFDDESIDCAYEIQAFTYAKDKVAVFSEIYRILKPGAKFSYLDWVLLDNFDKTNEVHVDHVRRTMPFIGAVDTVHYSEIENAMKQAGFTILLSEDASIGGHQGALINSERSHYWWVRVFARLLLPAKFIRMLRRLREDAEHFVEADRLRIATTSYQIVCQKPMKN